MFMICMSELRYRCVTPQCEYYKWIVFYAKDDPSKPTCQSCKTEYDIVEVT